MRNILADINAQPITNLCASTFTTSNLTGLSQIGAGGQDPPVPDTTVANRLFGSASLRKQRTTGAGVGSCGLKGSTTKGLTLATGDIIRWGFWAKATAAISLTPYWENTDGSPYTGGSGGAVTSLLANAWKWVTGTMTVKSTNTNLTAIGCGAYNPNASEGVSIWFNGLIITKNCPLPTVYCDGDTPGWHWSGTPGQSYSVGMPYALETIAGKPLYYGTNITPSLNSVTSLPSTSYTVASVQYTTSITNTPGLWESDPGRNRRVLAVSSGGYRADCANPDGSVTAFSTTGYDATSPHSIVARVHNVGIDLVVDGSVKPLANVPTMSPLASNLGLHVGSRDSSSYPEINTPLIVVFPYYLNDETSKRVCGWLARAAAAPIPVGY